MKEKEGISLVALIITIIVLIILTGTVIITMNQGDIIGKSEEAVFKHDVTTYREELVKIKMEEQLKRETGETTTLNLSPGVSDLAAKKDILSSFKDEYNDVLVVENGDLKGKFELLTSEDEKDKLYSKWLQEVDIPIAWNNEQAGDFTVTAEGVLTSYNGSEEIVIIPDTVTSIGNALYYNSNVTTVLIPNSVTSIGSNAFDGCTSLSNITIPNSVASIGDSAFCWCQNLTNITIPNSVTSIGSGVFSNCSGLTNITISNSVASIGDSAFVMSGLSNITIPSSVTSIGDYAFCWCQNLTNITIPNSVTSIGGNAFSYCSNLTNITIPSSVTSIGDYAFGESTNANFIVGSEEVKTLILNSGSEIAAEKITVDPSVN